MKYQFCYQNKNSKVTLPRANNNSSPYLDIGVSKCSNKLFSVNNFVTSKTILDVQWQLHYKHQWQKKWEKGLS